MSNLITKIAAGAVVVGLLGFVTGITGSILVGKKAQENYSQGYTIEAEKKENQAVLYGLIGFESALIMLASAGMINDYSKNKATFWYVES